MSVKRENASGASSAQVKVFKLSVQKSITGKNVIHRCI